MKNEIQCEQRKMKTRERDREAKEKQEWEKTEGNRRSEVESSY